MAFSVLNAANSARGKYSAEEWAVRVDLACAYRLFFHLGWHNLIYNHISARVPGPDAHFLINPFGLMYREITASNLLKVDLDGNKVEPSQYNVWQAGYVVHSSIHAHREDLKCVMHTHTVAGVAVACQRDGLLPFDIQSASLHRRIAYHDVEGITFDGSESARIAHDLGDKSLMILRNHGLLSAGVTVADAFHDLHLLEHSCRVQLALQSSGAAPKPMSAELIALTADQADPSHPLMRDNAALQWAAMRRWMDEIEPGYAQ